MQINIKSKFDLPVKRMTIHLMNNMIQKETCHSFKNVAGFFF